jgi:hypothetical protein
MAVEGVQSEDYGAAISIGDELQRPDPSPPRAAQHDDRSQQHGVRQRPRDVQQGEELPGQVEDRDPHAEAPPEPLHPPERLRPRPGRGRHGDEQQQQRRADAEDGIDAEKRVHDGYRLSVIGYRFAEA